MTCFSEYHSPVGPLLLSGDAHALTGLGFLREDTRIPPGWARDDVRFDRQAYSTRAGFRYPPGQFVGGRLE